MTRRDALTALGMAVFSVVVLWALNRWDEDARRRSIEKQPTPPAKTLEEIRQYPRPLRKGGKGQ